MNNNILNRLNKLVDEPIDDFLDNEKPDVVPDSLIDFRFFYKYIYNMVFFEFQVKNNIFKKVYFNINFAISGIILNFKYNDFQYCHLINIKNGDIYYNKLIKEARNILREDLKPLREILEEE